MLPVTFNDELNKLWNEFWPATDIKPFAVVDFINLIFFARHLEEVQENNEQAASFSGKPVEAALYTDDEEELRWSNFSRLGKQDLYLLFNGKDDGLLHFLKNKPAYKRWSKFDREGKTLAPTPELLAGTVKLISSLAVADSATRTEMNELLLKKAEAPADRPGDKLLITESNADTLAKNRFHVNEWKASILLLVLFISGFVGAYLYFGAKPRSAAAAVFKNKNIIASRSLDDSSVSPFKEAQPVKKKGAKGNKQQQASKTKTVAPLRQKEMAAEKNDTKSSEIKGKYKVISKAYFHNEPDESTRRNAFVVHWNNSYSTLKALDEKNGFVYVVFHNHLNQTSKGWLRKKDLKEAE